jgi:hypothetical protein
MVAEGLDPTRRCKLCDTPFNEHGEKHHVFVEANQDPGSAVNPPPKKKDDSKGQSTLIVAPAPDLVLRTLLRRLGVISAFELEEVERELTLGTVGIKPPDSKTSGFFAEPPANG